VWASVLTNARPLQAPRPLPVQPNLSPPITTVAQALAYKAELQALAPDVEFLMTLYLNSALTPQDIRDAKAAGIVGVKSYPKGVTTNSEGGIENYDIYDPVFAAMEEHGLVLNLHGELPSDHRNVRRARAAWHWFSSDPVADHLSTPRASVAACVVRTRAS